MPIKRKYVGLTSKRTFQRKKTLSLAEKVAKAMKNRKEIERAREENEKKRRTK